MRQPQPTFSAPIENRIVSAAILKAMRHVEEHFTKKITSRALAHSVGISPEHFCRSFKQATGLRLTEYVARLRVDKAREMLVHSGHSISQIALACGFQSLAQFNRTFKKLSATTPTGYRARQR